MARKTIEMRKLKAVLRLHIQGRGKKTISKTSGLSKNTVKKYIELYQALNLNPRVLDELDDKALSKLFTQEQKSKTNEKLKELIGFFPYMHKELRKTGVTRSLLWEEYKGKYPTGYQLTQFNEHYARWNKRVNPTMHVEYKAGDKMLVDYTGKKLPVINLGDGEVVEIEVFVSILGASQLIYAEASWSQQKADFILSCENSLYYYSGVPRAIVTDNLKSAVTKSHRYEPKLKDTLTKMQQMRLYGMHHAFKDVVEHNSAPGIGADDLVGQLVSAEFDDRYNRKIARLRSNARLRYKVAIEDITFEPGRNLDRDGLLRLAEGSYLTNNENILITGSTGVGKSYMACALGNQACQMEYRVIYFKTSRLLAQLKLCKADGSYIKMLRKLERQTLLILDDFGLQPIDPVNSYILMELVEDRYRSGSMIITSQVPVDKWYDLIQEKTLADAIMDRIIHKSHRIELEGESMQKKSIRTPSSQTKNENKL